MGYEAIIPDASWLFSLCFLASIEVGWPGSGMDWIGLDWIGLEDTTASSALRLVLTSILILSIFTYISHLEISNNRTTVHFCTDYVLETSTEFDVFTL